MCGWMGIGRAPLSVGGGVEDVRSMGLAAVLGAAEGATLMKETSGASMGYCEPKMKDRRYCGQRSERC